MRGDLVSRPIDEVLIEAEQLVKSGVRELLVISQDTSAYGVDMKYAEREWHGARHRTRMTELCDRAVRARRLGTAALRLSLSTCGRSHSVDGGSKDPAVPRYPVPAFKSAHSQADETPGGERQDAGAHSRLAQNLSTSDHPQHVYRRVSRRDGRRVRAIAGVPARSTARSRRRVRVFAGRRRACQSICLAPCPKK